MFLSFSLWASRLSFTYSLNCCAPCEILVLSGPQNHYTLYLNDGLCAREGEPKALEASVLVCSTLGQAGFLVNDKKSIWKPTQHLQWLGFVIDLSKGHIEVPAERVVAVKRKLQSICQLSLVPAKMLASVVGSIISMSLHGYWASESFHDPLYVCTVADWISWWVRLEITPEARQELEFWRVCMADYKCQLI